MTEDVTDGMRPLRVLIVVGSTRPESYTAAAARFTATCVKECGHQPFIHDHRKRPLPFADPAYHRDPLSHPDPNVRAVVQMARLADAFILTSPVYHNSYSAILKNVLDHLTIDEFFHKPVGLVVHGSNLTAVQVCDQLRTVVRGLYGLCVPEQAVTTPPDFTIREGDGRPTVTSPAMRARILDLTMQVLKFARR